ncbi:unnamed protein product [Rotaria magnacalcarata]|uniref:Caspase family p20 domain-containing protein n=1 Tax=Rotaria magnacalcarata TaxID=392030 RepID=A0A816LGI6_9BILA|nr:unnamed protein product [Rotaria magnacalcarata]
MSRRRLALIFGNDNYGGDKQLTSCVKDARDMESKLRSVGFTCTQSHNSDKRAMDCAFRDFCSKIKNNDCILIYFSGHGMEQNGKNYLVPIEKVCDPEFDCVCLDTMLKQLNRCGDNILNVIILDACRADKDNNTWKTKGANAEECSEPAYGKALTSYVRLPTESQFALIFSSDPGTVSFGSKAGENSFFTSALLNHLITPNLTLEEIMRNVQNEILEKSSKRQRPWLNSCLREPFYLNGGSTRPTTASSGIAAASKPASTPRPASAASTTSWSEEFDLSGNQLRCKGRPCAKCKKCRDWHFNGDDETWRWVCNWENWTKADEKRWYDGGWKCFTKRNDGATCRRDLRNLRDRDRRDLDDDVDPDLLLLLDRLLYDLLRHICLCDRH